MNSDQSDQEATILEIQRLSTEDGPGIRTTVFLKGCSLNCAWCHNPESISAKPQVHWIANQCIDCNSCRDICPEKALSRSSEGLVFDRKICSGCGICAEECPATAIELLGKNWRLADLLNEVMKDKAYFEASEGGVTIGGGEPLLQPEFVIAFLKGLKKQGVHTALDTCGHCSQQALNEILPFTDVVLFDLKQIDTVRHARYTGFGNEKIISNLNRILRQAGSGNSSPQIWIRTPVIPGATDTEENIRGLGEFLAKDPNGRIQRWELLAFNNLCRDKYARLDRQWDFEKADLLDRDRMEKLAQTARRSGVEPTIVHWSGTTR